VRRALAIVGFVILHAILIGALLNGFLTMTGIDLS
jgi:hypothetical protein